MRRRDPAARRHRAAAMTCPRRYFYEIDRHGVLWHDGTPLEDEAFLASFFARLRPNDTGACPGHPFVSPCAGELNYVRAEVTPIVFRRLAAAGDLEARGGVRARFDPTTLRVDAHGRLYHAAPVGGIGLLAPAVAIALAAAIEEHRGGFVFVDGARRIG